MEDDLVELLETFSCIDDPDIETFLHKRAIPFEKVAKSRTYLICNEEKLRGEHIQLKDIVIYGYVSLALNVLTVTDNVSNRIRKELDGFNAKKNGEQLNVFPCYLIGQIARNSNVSKECITGDELIGYANYIIQLSVKMVGGRYMMVECRDDEKLIDFYEGNDFKQIAKLPKKDENLIQMIRKIQ